MVTAADILKARNDVRESQEVFAARFGVDQSTVHRWETEGLPDRGTAKAIVERVLKELSAPSKVDAAA